MSNVTHYVHILCRHSCGAASVPTRFSRNLVYTRSEEVNGAKTPDDTLNTVADCLLGSTDTLFEQPEMFRTGYNKYEKVE